MKKIVSVFMTVVLFCLAVVVPTFPSFASDTSSLTESTTDTITEEEFVSTYTVSIPMKIEASESIETAKQYTVAASNVVVEEDKEFAISVSYDGVLSDSSDTEIDYSLYVNDISVVDGEEILSVNSVEEAKEGAVICLTEQIKYAGDYSDSITFEFYVRDRTYTIEEIEESEYLYAIGKTDPSYVVARFNEDYTDVTIFKNGSQSDGLMMDWNSDIGSSYADYTVSPMNTMKSSLTSVTINEGVKTLGNCAFYSCSKITDVILPNELTSLGDCAFYYCSKLSLLSQLPETLTNIGREAFRNCSSLTSIIIPEGVTVIKEETFWDCIALTNVVLPNSLKEILFRGFYSCKKLTSIVFPEGMTKIGDYAFSHCFCLKFDAFPTTLLYIGQSAFENCFFNETYNIPSSVEFIGTSAFLQKHNINFEQSLMCIEVADENSYYKDVDGVLYTKDGTILMQYPHCKENASYEVLEGTTRIDDYALSYCYNLTELLFPEGLATVGENAFYNSLYIKEMILPNSVEVIEKRAFGACQLLLNLTLSSNLKKIESDAFNGTMIQHITIPSSVTSLHKASLRGMEYLEEIIVKEDNLNYASVDGVLYNKDLTILMQYPSHKTDAEYSVLNGTLTINEEAFWHNDTSKYFGINLKVINIPESVINFELLKYPSSIRFCCLETINIAESNATYSSVDGVVFDKGRTTLYCYPVAKEDKSYTIPETVTSLGQYSFKENALLTEVAISNGVTALSAYTFYECTALTSVTIPSSVTSINSNAFYNCKNIKTIYGVAGSSAETFANSKGYTFVAIEE